MSNLKKKAKKRRIRGISMHPTNWIAVDILESIARYHGVTFSQVKRLFVYEHDRTITEEFWYLINQDGYRFMSVNFCSSCGQFDLE